jgi:LmbE family N-acetylglucosaminyl deacetylase
VGGLEPDAVFQPSLHDIHQDHQVIAAEGLRAFKRTTILGYEIPWNNFDFAYQAYFALERTHLERKVAALEKYASQQHRRYSDPRVHLERRAARTASTSTASTRRCSRSIASWPE